MIEKADYYFGVWEAWGSLTNGVTGQDTSKSRVIRELKRDMRERLGKGQFATWEVQAHFPTKGQGIVARGEYTGKGNDWR